MIMRGKYLILALGLSLAMPVQAQNWGGLLKGVLQQQLPGQQPAQAQPQAPSKQQAGIQAVGLLLGAVKDSNISEDEERQIGAQIAGNVLGAAPLVKDDRLQTYVNQVGRWVALQSERPDIEWRFGVIETEDINAFAAPGGYILITKGLYRRLKNEAELAGVLGHEIGHVLMRHHLKIMQQSKIVGALGAVATAQAKQDWAQNLIGNGAEIVARGLDKDAEFEADRIGMVLAARAGYDAYALPAVLQEIGHIPDKDNRMALLKKTHPHPETRFEQLAEAVGDRLDGLEPGAQLPNRLYRIK